MTKEPQLANEALYYLLTYAYTWGQRDAADLARYIRQSPAERAPGPYVDPREPALASIIHTIRLWTELPEIQDSATIEAAIETLRAAGVVAVPGSTQDSENG